MKTRMIRSFYDLDSLRLQTPWKSVQKSADNLAKSFLSRGQKCI